MPSPFPGMDPYLEGSRWTSVHAQLGAEIARMLAPRLRPRYVALLQERVVIETVAPASAPGPDDGGEPQPPGARYPDVAVIEVGGAAGPGGGPGGGGVAMAAPLRLATVVPEAVPHVSVEVRDTAEQRLVTAIEVLSPTNKRGGDGRDEYLAKRSRLLLGDVHLLEIDLLRQGQRVPMLRPLPAAPYFVFLSRAENRPMTEVWPIALDQRLPTVPVPLLAGDADVPLDLHRALASVYDVVGYDLILDYARPPEVALRPEDAAWAEGRIRAARPV